jgi:hypothetical protein
MDLVSGAGKVVTASSEQSRRQLITLAVDTLGSRTEADLVSMVVYAAKGVEAVETDPVSPRVWVFANGSVDPEALCDALASWGYGAYVLENRFTAPE